MCEYVCMYACMYVTIKIKDSCKSFWLQTLKESKFHARFDGLAILQCTLYIYKTTSHYF